MKKQSSFGRSARKAIERARHVVNVREQTKREFEATNGGRLNRRRAPKVA